MKLRVFSFLFAVCLIIGQLQVLPSGVQAQSDDVNTDILIAAPMTAGALPIAPAFLRLVRITLDPGAVSPEHTHPGPEFGWVESGVIKVIVNGPASVKQRSSKPNDPFEGIESGTETTLDHGDQIIYPAGTALTFKNEGDDPAEVLALVVLPAADGHPPLIDYVGDDPTEESFNGVTSEVLGDAIMTTLPTGPSEIAVNRLQLKGGQSLPGNRNPVLYSVESGDCQFTVTDGSVQISRKREPGPQTDVPFDENIKLRSGDAMFFPNGLRTTSRGENSAELDLLSVTIAPTSDTERLPEESRGAIRFKAPAKAEVTPDDSSTDNTPSGFGVGDSVYVNSTDVNLRDSPSLNGGQVTVLLYGQEMTIDGDSIDAEGVTWWPVHITADDTIAGYVSAEFLQSDPVE